MRGAFRHISTKNTKGILDERYGYEAEMKQAWAILGNKLNKIIEETYET